jgi:hypothetical protein
MNVGLRALLLAAAVVLFILAIFSDVHQGDFIAAGLACTSAAVLVREMGWDRSMATRRMT